jgi:hypothetical protein
MFSFFIYLDLHRVVSQNHLFSHLIPSLIRGSGFSLLGLVSVLFHFHDSYFIKLNYF